MEYTQDYQVINYDKSNKNVEKLMNHRQQNVYVSRLLPFYDHNVTDLSDLVARRDY